MKSIPSAREGKVPKWLTRFLNWYVCWRASSRAKELAKLEAELRKIKFETADLVRNRVQLELENVRLTNLSKLKNDESQEKSND